MNHPPGVLSLSAEYRGSQNDKFKLDAHPCFYAKERTLHIHSLKSQLADTYYFRDVGSKLEIFLLQTKQNQVSVLCIVTMKAG